MAREQKTSKLVTTKYGHGVTGVVINLNIEEMRLLKAVNETVKSIAEDLPAIKGSSIKDITNFIDKITAAIEDPKEVYNRLFGEAEDDNKAEPTDTKRVHNFDWSAYETDKADNKATNIED